MATRQGRFGRLPRQAPDLTAAIVAMLREFQAQRQQNIIDAWKNGGSFEGKKVTDGMLLNFFDDKLEGLDKADPLYDEAKNTRQQYRFAVDNSKMELSYAQGKVSDGAMSAFYKREAMKHPANSEIWRQLMKLSAQYKDRAAVGSSRGRGGGRAAKRKADVETPQKKELAYGVVTDVLLDLARQRGIINSGQSLESATVTTGEGFGDLQVWQGDYGAMNALVNEFATSPEWANYRNELTAYIRKHGDPSFDGNYSLQGIQSMRSAKVKALNARLAAAYAGGTKTQQKALQKELTLVTKAGSALGVIDPMAAIEENRENWQKAVSDPNASPLDIWQANATYRAQVADAYNQLLPMAQAANGSDGGWLSVHAGRLFTELNALDGNVDTIGSTLWEESRGHITGIGGQAELEKSDAVTTAESVNANWDAVQKLMTGEYVIARGDAEGQPVDDASAPLTAVKLSDVQALGLPVAYSADQPRTTSVGGVTADTSGILSVVFGQPVKVVQLGAADQTGRPTTELDVKPGTRADVGAMFVYPDGTEVYMVYDAQGVMRYSVEAPFVEGATMRNTKSGVEVVLPADTSGATTFDPYTAVDPLYTNPETVGVMSQSTFRSSTMAYEAAKFRDRTGLQTTEKGLQNALYAESGGNEEVYAQLYAEAQSYRTQADAAMRAYGNRYNEDFLPQTLSPDARDAGARGAIDAAEAERTSRQRSAELLRAAYTNAPAVAAPALGAKLAANLATAMSQATAAADATSLRPPDAVAAPSKPTPPLSYEQIAAMRTAAEQQRAAAAPKPTGPSGPVVSPTGPKTTVPKPAAAPKAPTAPPPIKPPPPPPQLGPDGQHWQSPSLPPPPPPVKATQPAPNPRSGAQPI